jgi:hypothetical protein
MTGLKSFSLPEIAAADADRAGYGQFWCYNSSGTTKPMFTDDAGADHELAYA